MRDVKASYKLMGTHKIHDFFLQRYVLGEPKKEIQK